MKIINQHIKTADHDLPTHVIRIRLHVKLCKRSMLDPDGVYYYAIKQERGDFIQINSTAIRITQDLQLAEIFETSTAAQSACKTLTIREATLATVQPASRKIFFEASLKGLRRHAKERENG